MNPQNDQGIWMKSEWPVPPQVRAGTTTRICGYSQPPYDAFNLASHVGDDHDRVKQNRNQLKKALSLPLDPVWLRQEHSNIAVRAELYSGRETADAIYTDSHGTVLTVLTADCIPILLSNDTGTEIAAIHAGWRGLCTMIIDNTLGLFRARSSHIIAWLGPHISSSHYEVGYDVKSACIEKLGIDVDIAFMPDAGNRWQADLGKIASLQLLKHGVDRIYNSGYCTYKDNEMFYSYRREKKTGRMATLIWIDDRPIS